MRRALRIAQRFAEHGGAGGEQGLGRIARRGGRLSTCGILRGSGRRRADKSEHGKSRSQAAVKHSSVLLYGAPPLSDRSALCAQAGRRYRARCIVPQLASIDCDGLVAGWM